MTQQPELRLVPTVPTPEMVKAFWSAFDGTSDGQEIRTALIAMLAAAPQPDHGVSDGVAEKMARVLFERGRTVHDAESWETAGEEMQQWLLGHAEAMLAALKASEKRNG